MFEAIGKGENTLADDGDRRMVEELHRGAQGHGTSDVESARLIATGVRAEGHVPAGIVGPLLYSSPSEFNWKYLILNGLIDVQYAPTLWAEEPFMAIGGECVDAASLDVERKSAEALDGVDEVKNIVALADLSDCLQIYPETTEIIDPADGQ